MATKHNPKEISESLTGVLAVLNKYPSVKIGDKTLKPDEDEWTKANVTAHKKAIDDDLAERDRLERELTTVNNRLSDNATIGNGIITRARSLFRGTFGANSDEYEQAGGTRASERKPATKKKPSTDK